MAKQSAASKSETESSPVAPRPLVTRPGLKKFTGDVIGFHDLETQGHIFGIPRGAKASDSKLEPAKPSIFIIFELLEDCKVTEGSEEEATELTAKKGDMVGVWVKGGMRPLRNMLGLQVLMQHTGEKKLKGRPKAQSPMKTYQFDVSEGSGGLIPVIEDSRKDSRDVPIFLDVDFKAKKAKKPTQEREPGADEDEDDDTNPGF